VTRILFFYLNAAIRLWEDGVPTETLDAALRGVGWPMGPLRLIDEVGLDVADLILGEMARYFPGRFIPTRACAHLFAAGLRGRKNGTGTGFYRYDRGQESVNDRAREIAGRPAVQPTAPGEIATRLMGVMLAEAQCCLDEGVVQSPDEIDFALLSGAGFPAFHGGLFRYAASLSSGASEISTPDDASLAVQP
jgi:3-hydroxyacyl-CoA dehydrogenase/enoyl-CoA hydratase/3-hydroxybutyryl-CoA epimerase